MNNKVTMFVRKISLYMANPRRFHNLIVPLLRQSRRRKYNKDKTTAMIENQCLFMEGLENVIKNYGSCRSFAIERRCPHPHKAIDFKTLRDNISSNICGMLLNSTQAASQSLAEKVVLLDFSVISLYASKYPTLRPVL